MEAEMKTLEEAIGCWTGREGLTYQMNGVKQSVKFVQISMKKGDPEKLRGELRLLKIRLKSMIEMTQDTIRRCDEIINTKELEGEKTL